MSDNWGDFLDVSGIAAIRYQYWEAYNQKREQLKAEQIALSSRLLGEAAKADAKAVKIAEEFIVSAIPDELTVALQTATLLQIELEIEKEGIFARVPRIVMHKGDSSDESSDEKEDGHGEDDTSVNSQHLLCAAHLGKLVDVIEKMGERAPLKRILESRPDDDKGDVRSESSR